MSASRALALCLLALGPLALPAAHGGGGYGAPLYTVTTTAGPALAAERDGRTLYTPVRRDGRIARCTDACAHDWPPFLVAPADFPTDGLGIVHREDGRRQWTLDGRPLHFFAGDRRRGEARGAGAIGWRMLTPPGLSRRSDDPTPASGTVPRPSTLSVRPPA